MSFFPPKQPQKVVVGQKHHRTADLHKTGFNAILGPVVQSIVSLMKSLRGQLVKGFWTL